MEFLTSFLRRHFAGKPPVTSRNIGFFWSMAFSSYRNRWGLGWTWYFCCLQVAIQADHTNIAGCIGWAAGKVLQGSYLNETASLLSGKRKSAVYIIFVHYKAVQGDFGTSVCVNWRKRALRLSEFLFFNVDLKINKEMFRYQISPVLCLVSTIPRDYPRSPKVRGSGNFLLKVPKLSWIPLYGTTGTWAFW